MVELSPGMRQYMKIKNEHPDCIILFRMGDFYETFYDDAKLVARELEITLTARGKGEKRATLAGIPYHALDPYLAKLIKKGYKVGIVEQLEDPKLAKGLVERGLVRIITPGTVLENMILNKDVNNYIFSFFKDEESFGISYMDVSTGEFKCAKVKESEFYGELAKVNPAEIIYPSSMIDSPMIEELKTKGYILNEFSERFFYYDKALDTLKEQFKVDNMRGFGVVDEVLVNACGGLIGYVKDKQMKGLEHVKKVELYSLSDFMILDNATIRNLELVQNIVSKNDDSTLLKVLDKTVTPMGKRLLRKWITAPLINREEIEKRLDSVDELKEDLVLRHELIEALNEIYDIERLIVRVSFGNANPKDLVSLANSFSNLPKIKHLLEKLKSPLLSELSSLSILEEPRKIISESIKEEPSTIIREGNIIRKGYNQELDELRSISFNAKSYLAEMEAEERKKTGINSLKIRYNKVIGYFIEITKKNIDSVPEYYIRKQSQINSERFVTEELKELEVKILGAQERIFEIEYNLFMEVLEKLREFVMEVQMTSEKLSVLDCLLSFSVVSNKNNYIKPLFNDEGIIELKDCRHPVVEMFGDIDFIPNNCSLSDKQRTMIITGPNMAGKSTYLRQVALCSLMAQVGCFVPASSARLCVVDRIFSRIGAYDDLVNKQSTFMVEMNETANILNNATENSLIILDEIGRGTSTYDGVSLAWAISEYLNNEIKAKTLFATHYHHLNKLEERFEGIKNYNVTVDESDDKIVFLRKIVEGGTDKSYGIQVAKLAGVPDAVINCAKHVMDLIELEDDFEDKLIEQKPEEEKELKIEPKSEFNVEDLRKKIIEQVNLDVDKIIERKVEESLKDAKIYDLKNKQTLEDFDGD